MSWRDRATRVQTSSDEQPRDWRSSATPVQTTPSEDTEPGFWQKAAEAVKERPLTAASALFPPVATAAFLKEGDLSKHGVAGAALRGFGQGESLGFADELRGVQGAGDALYDKLGVPGHQVDVVQHPGEGLGDYLRRAYRYERDQARGENDTAAAEHPVAFKGAELAGTVASPVPAAKARTGRLLLATGQGLASGLGNAKELDAEGAITTLTGGGAGLAGGGVGEGLGALAGFFRKAAQTRTLKGAGFSKASLKGMPPAKQGELADDIVKQGLEPFGAGKETVAERSAKALEEAGQKIGAERTGLDSARTPLDWDAVKQALEAQKAKMDPLAALEHGHAYDNPIKAAETAKTRGMGYEQLGEMKGTAQGMTKYDSTASPPLNDVRKAIAATLRKQEEEQISKNAPGVATSLKDAFKKYATAAKVNPVAQTAVAAEKGNQPFGLVGSLLLGGGALHGGTAAIAGHPSAGAGEMAAGAALALGKRWLDRHGSAAAAPLLRGAAQVAPHVGRVTAPAAQELSEEERQALADWLRGGGE